MWLWGKFSGITMQQVFNPFKVFNLPVDFALDLQQLSKMYIELQKNYHPDKFINSSKEEQLKALNLTTEINQAYKILQNPTTRALAIVELALGEQETKSVFDTEFLLEQLNQRERLEDNATDLDYLDEFLEEAEQQKQSYLATVQEAIKKQDWQETNKIIARLQFCDKLLSEINLAIDKLN